MGDRNKKDNLGKVLLYGLGGGVGSLLVQILIEGPAAFTPERLQRTIAICGASVLALAGFYWFQDKDKK